MIIVITRAVVTASKPLVAALDLPLCASAQLPMQLRQHAAICERVLLRIAPPADADGACRAAAVAEMQSSGCADLRESLTAARQLCAEMADCSEALERACDALALAVSVDADASGGAALVGAATPTGKGGAAALAMAADSASASAGRSEAAASSAREEKLMLKQELSKAQATRRVHGHCVTRNRAASDSAAHRGSDANGNRFGTTWSSTTCWAGREWRGHPSGARRGLRGITWEGGRARMRVHCRLLRFTAHRRSCCRRTRRSHGSRPSQTICCQRSRPKTSTT